jgi:hypothetical protein
MIEILEFGEHSITRWVDKLIKEIENHEEFIAIAKVNDSNNYYTFIALFKNKCVIGKYTALVYEWGTNDGMSGEGGRGFIRMNDFLLNQGIEAIELELSSKDTKKIGRTSKLEWEKRKVIWKQYLDELKQRIL